MELRLVKRSKEADDCRVLDGIDRDFIPCVKHCAKVILSPPSSSAIHPV
jgi:hypothetical protein